MREAIKTIRSAGKVAATLAFVEEDAKAWVDEGAQLVAVTSDMSMLTGQANKIAKRFG